MRRVSDYLYQSAPDHPFQNEVKTSAYLLIRRGGNLLMYSSKSMEHEAERIRALGGIAHQYLNHRDEASKSCNWVGETFNAPLACHQKEAEAVAKVCTVHKTFDEETDLHPDLRAIPTPGHCPGSTCYLWQAPDRRYLFTGDTIYLTDGRWRVFVSRGTSAEMIASLELISELAFDVLVPGLFQGDVAQVPVTPAEIRRQTGEIIQRLRQGEIH